MVLVHKWRKKARLRLCLRQAGESVTSNRIEVAHFCVQVKEIEVEKSLHPIPIFYADLSKQFRKTKE